MPTYQSSTVSTATATATACPVTLPATINAGDLIILQVATKPYTATITTPAGYTAIGNSTTTSGTTASGTDTGSMLVAVYAKVAAGTEGGTTVTVTITSGNSSWVCASRWTKTTSTNSWSLLGATALDNTSGTTWSNTFAGTTLGIKSGDELLAMAAIPTDVAITWASAPSLTATGATISAGTELQTLAVSTGNDSGGHVSRWSCTAGAQTGSAVYTETISGTTTNAVGAGVLVRIREVVPTRLYFSSTNGTRPVSVTADSSWEDTATALLAKASVTKQNTAIPGNSQVVTKNSSANPGDVMWSQHVTDPLDVAQVIAGAFSAVIRCNESATTADGFMQVVIRVVSNDGATVRGTLYSGQTFTTVSATTSDPNGEMGAGSANTRILSGITMGSVSAQANDRLVIEWGARSCVATTGVTFFARFGDPTATGDHALTAAVTTDLVPWLEFDSTITFGTPVTPATSAWSIGHVGDSLTDPFETNEDDVLRNLGYIDARVDGLVGRYISGPSPSPSSLEVINTWRAAGFDCWCWIVALGTNDVMSAVASTHQTSIDTILLKIAEVPGDHVVLWIGCVGDDTIGEGTPSPGTGGDFATFNAKVIATTPPANVRLVYVPWPAYAIANGDASWWLHDANKVHMTSTGLAFREQFILDAAAEYVPQLPARVSPNRRR